jgi:putative oxidoreductase
MHSGQPTSAALQFHAAARHVKRVHRNNKDLTVNFDKTLDRFAPLMLSLMRVVFAVTFFAHGTQKILGFPASNMNPPAFSLPWTAGVLELVGGALLIVGLFTRPVAFVMSGLMAFAYFLAHAPKGIFPALNGGDAAILFCFGFLYLVVAGAGSVSLDAYRGRTSTGKVTGLTGAPQRA